MVFPSITYIHTYIYIQYIHAYNAYIRYKHTIQIHTYIYTQNITFLRQTHTHTSMPTTNILLFADSCDYLPCLGLGTSKIRFSTRTTGSQENMNININIWKKEVVLIRSWRRKKRNKEKGRRGGWDKSQHCWIMKVVLTWKDTCLQRRERKTYGSGHHYSPQTPAKCPTQVKKERDTPRGEE